MYVQRPIRLEDIPGMEHRMQFLGICLLTEIKEYPSPYWINSLNMIILLAVITLPNWILYLDSISINVISAGTRQRLQIGGFVPFLVIFTL